MQREPLNISGLEAVPASLKGSVLTIGNFDGVHRGHRRILSHARTLADAAGVAVVAMTFNPPPDLVVRPADAPQRISPHEQRIALLHDAGADAVITIQANRALLAKTPAEFIDEILIRHFAPSHIVEGPNFFFGHKRAGNIDTLCDAGKTRGFAMHVVDAYRVMLDGESTRISSTLIRRLIAAGRVELAADYLTHPFTLVGPVISGEQVGRVLQYPTANLESGQQVTPADGVYAGRAKLHDIWYPAAISIGHRETIGPAKPRSIEASLLGAQGEFYHETLSLEFHARLRSQERFDSLETLKAAIGADVDRVAAMFPPAQELGHA